MLVIRTFISYPRNCHIRHPNIFRGSFSIFLTQTGNIVLFNYIYSNFIVSVDFLTLHRPANNIIIGLYRVDFPELIQYLRIYLAVYYADFMGLNTAEVLPT